MKQQNVIVRTYKFMASMKFAVIILIIFALAMIVGTFVESYYGTDFVNRLIYKSIPFFLIQASMFLSVFFSMMDRLPPKKRLFGFYLVHTGLITIGAGSVITYLAGIDGSVTLTPGDPKRELKVNEDILIIKDIKLGKETIVKLPYTAFEKDMNQKVGPITLRTYYPFSGKKLDFIDSATDYSLDPEVYSSKYYIYDDKNSTEFILSSHPEASPFLKNFSMGRLHFSYFPPHLKECLSNFGKSGIITYNGISRQCQRLEDRNIELQTTDKGNRYITLAPKGGKSLNFFPDFTPFPITPDFQIIPMSPIKVYSRTLLEQDAAVFFFKDKIYQYRDQKWEESTLNKNEVFEIPKSKIKIKLISTSNKLSPGFIPKFKMPIQKDGQLIEGDQKSIHIQLAGKSYYVNNDKVTTIQTEDHHFQMIVSQKKFQLPFELSLDRFVMKTNPGTNQPASFESFVRQFTSTGTDTHHIFMNNPLKYDGLTFYQASYFEVSPGQYGSVLSVNMDPGRAIKYIGSILLVLGAMIHYYIRRKKEKIS